MNEILQRLRRGSITRAVSAWLAAALTIIAVVGENYRELSFAQSAPLGLELAVGFGIFLLLSACAVFLNNPAFDGTVLLITAFALSFEILFRQKDFYLLFGALFIWAFLAYFLMRDDRAGLCRLPLGEKAQKIIILIAALVYVAFVGTVCTLRYLNYTSATFDFGIFSQMYYYLKETGIPYTTCERDVLLSHFAIHLSPVYYLLLPIYWLFPHPITLLIAQPLILASGVIPLYLLAKHFGVSGKGRVCVCAAYCLFPALIGGCMYDIHENLFLTPFLLWLFYFYEKKRMPLFWLFFVLTLTVKEDAAVFTACVGCYIMFARKDWRRGLTAICASIVYFLGAIALLNAMGWGVMDYRFNNFLSNPDLGIASVLVTIFTNPGYLISEVFVAEKLPYFFLMLLPLGFLPILVKKPSQLFLLIPWLLINLMPDYSYQYSLNFQYNFGAAAIMFYLAVQNLGQFSTAVRRGFLLFISVACVLSSAATVGNKLDIIADYQHYSERNRTLTEYLEQIPEDASVTTSGYFMPRLSQRREAYDYKAMKKTDYVIIDLQPGHEEGAMDYVREYQTNGYTQTLFIDNLIIILQSPDYMETAE